MSDLPERESEFSRSISAFLPLVKFRKPKNDGDKAQIYRLRYAAYLREGALPPGAPELFKDAFDDSPNGMTFGGYVGGALSSSIRLHVATPENPEMPAMTVFADKLSPLLDRGLRILDPTRFVADAQAARLYTRLPYATVRLCALAGAHYGIDVILATVRLEHQSFYKRLFGHEMLCEPRAYPSLAKPISLMAVEYSKIRETVYGRYPFFKSTPEERREIFEDDGAPGVES